ncbi:MAG: class D beta-lactamase [Bacteroidota bacterium]|nr:class D beta-lactamase [Bacteroidota bacterium]
MATRKTVITILLIAVTVFTAFRIKQKEEIRNDFKKYYDEQNVEGSFVLYDSKNDKLIFYNKKQYTDSFSPASTFKICNSLIGLETGIIKDENFVIPWDSVVRQNPKWNTDHDLKTAFKNSTVWYYRELARRVGEKKMKYWLDKSKFGNMDMSGGVDLFWLRGGLRITPEQQIDFLKRLHDNKLVFSKRSTEIVKRIMIVKDTLGYVLRAKTGWSDGDKKSIGWYIGYLETNDNVYYFSNCIQTPDFDKAKARIEITDQIFYDLKLKK